MKQCSCFGPKTLHLWGTRGGAAGVQLAGCVVSNENHLQANLIGERNVLSGVQKECVQEYLLTDQLMDKTSF